MKFLLLLTTLVLAAAASASEASQTAPLSGIAPAPDANLYAAVPEPSHAMLLMMGLLGLTVRRRR
jgi:hypothetical protein